MFYIRADGNEKIGMGHVMRCLSIAEALREEGEEVLFLAADAKPAGIIEERGFSVRILNSCYEDMEAELPRFRDFMALELSKFKDSMAYELPRFRDSMASGLPKFRDFAAENRTHPIASVEKRYDIVSQKPKILVDSYFITDAYLKALRDFATVILMDDEEKAVYPCDALINDNIYGDALSYKEDYPAGVKFFLGCGYMPLREQFRDVEYAVRDEVTDILLTTGGGDGCHMALSMVKYLLERAEKQQGKDSSAGADENWRSEGGDTEIHESWRSEGGDVEMHGSWRSEGSDTEVHGSWQSEGGDTEVYESWQSADSRAGADESWHIVCGPYCTDTKELERLAGQHGFLKIHKNVTDMSELMRHCDIAVSAAGSTLYELCRVGVPTVGFYFAENQRQNMEAFEKRTPVRNAGDFSVSPGSVLEQIEKEVEKLCASKELRESISRAMQKLVDGKGAERLAKGLIEL